MNSDEEYIKWFNIGYSLHQELPSVANKVKKAQGILESMSGVLFVRGIERSELERSQKLEKILNKERERQKKSQTKQKSREKDL